MHGVDKFTAAGDSCCSSSENESISSSTRKANLRVLECHQFLRILKCFSLASNVKHILNMDSSDKTCSLGVIHGLRVLTMAWIIMGHTYGLINPSIHSNAFSAEDMYTKFLYQGLLNATLSVDTFFFISGLLTVYVSWTKVSKLSSIPVVKFTLLRYMRLTPAYAASIGLAFVFPLMSSGPLWRETVDPITSTCYESWWTNLLYINNFVKTDKLCLMHSWYLSNDMQMHLFAIVFLSLLLKSKLLAFLFLSASIVSCTAFAAVETYVNDYPPTIVSTSPAVDDRWKYILDFYYKPWPHLPSYCVGLIVGFALSSKSKFKLSSAQKRTTCVFLGFILFIVLYGVYPWNLGWKIPPEITALYSSTFRTAWTGCCAFMTYSLLTEHKDSFASQILCWKAFIPFSRLTYMAFLTHPFVIWFYSGSLRERFTPTHFNYFHLFLGHYLLTYMLSLVFGLCFESPFMSVIKIVMEEKNMTSTKQQESRRNKTQPDINLMTYNITNNDQASTRLPTTLGITPSVLYFDTNTV